MGLRGLRLCLDAGEGTWAGEWGWMEGLRRMGGLRVVEVEGGGVEWWREVEGRVNEEREGGRVRVVYVEREEEGVTALGKARALRGWGRVGVVGDEVGEG